MELKDYYFDPNSKAFVRSAPASTRLKQSLSQLEAKVALLSDRVKKLETLLKIDNSCEE